MSKIGRRVQSKMQAVRDVLHWEHPTKIENPRQSTPYRGMRSSQQEKTSDTFAKHFAAHYPNRKEKLTTGEAHKMMEISIEWQEKESPATNPLER